MTKYLLFALSLVYFGHVQFLNADPVSIPLFDQDKYLKCLQTYRDSVLRACANLNIGNTGSGSCDQKATPTDTVIKRCQSASSSQDARLSKADESETTDRNKRVGSNDPDNSGFDAADFPGVPLSKPAAKIGSSSSDQNPKARLASAKANNDDDNDDSSAAAKKTSVQAKAAPQSSAKSRQQSDDSSDDSSSSDQSGSSSSKSASSKNSSRDASGTSSSSNNGSQNSNDTTNSFKAANSANSANATDVSGAQAQANQDLMSCTQWQARAQACCNNPTACLSDSDKTKIRQLNQIKYAVSNNDNSGLAATCTQMQQTGDDGSSINLSLGAACTGPQYNCSSSCSQVQQKYLSLLNSTSTDSGLYSVYSSAYSRVSTSKSACDQLQSKGNALASDGLQVDTSAFANYCGSQAGMSPQSASNTPSTNPPTSAGNANPANAPAASSVGAAQTTGSGYTAERGQAGMLAATTKSNQFNLGNNADQRLTNGSVLQPSPYGTPPTVTPIASGGGGMGAGGGGAGAHPPSFASGRGASGSAGYSTDIDKGFRSGGGSFAQPGSTNGYTGGGAGAGPGRDPASLGGGNADFDLKAYLPGGRLDPARRLSGSVLQSQINLKEEDIWRRISNKFLEKCKLGELLDCK